MPIHFREQKPVAMKNFFVLTSLLSGLFCSNTLSLERFKISSQGIFQKLAKILKMEKRKNWIEILISPLWSSSVTWSLLPAPHAIYPS